MLSQEEFINKLFNNELADFVNSMENEYQKLLKKYSKEIKKIELNMNEFVKGNRPDYVGFIKYVYSLYDDAHNDKSISTEYNLQFVNDYVPQYDLFYFNYIVYHKLYIFFEHKQNSSITTEDSFWIQLFILVTRIDPELTFNARIYNSLNDSKSQEEVHNFNGDFKAKFYSSFINNNHDDAIRCLEHCEDLDKGEYEYLNALVYFKEENYQKSLEYFNKIDNTCIDYKNSIMYKMQIYAIIDTNKLFELLNENKNNLAKFEVDNLILENILYLEFNNLQKEKYTDIYKAIIGHCKNSTSEILNNIDLLLIEFFDVLFDIYDQQVTLNVDLDDIQNGKKIVENIRFVLELLNIDRFKFIIDENRLNIDIMIDKLVNYYNKYNNDINILEKFANFLYKHQYIKYFCNFINQHISLFEKMSKIDKKYLNYICEAYSEEKIRNNVDENIERIYNFVYDENKNYENKLIIEKLSNEGIIAYKAAELYYDLSKQVDYGWKDAGMLSLSYFRIIELELNKKILKKITNDNLSIIKNYYYRYINNYNISEKDKEIYKKKWHFIFEKKENNNYMLGQIYLYFKNLSNIDNMNDELAQFLYNKTKEIVSEESLKNSFFTDMISNEIRNKYRNPPAHTKYLKYDTAKECREYVINQLNKLFDILA